MLEEPKKQLGFQSLKGIQSLAKMAAVMIPYKNAVGAAKAKALDDQKQCNYYCVVTNYWKERQSDGRYKLPEFDLDLYAGVRDMLPEDDNDNDDDDDEIDFEFVEEGSVVSDDDSHISVGVI